MSGSLVFWRRKVVPSTWCHRLWQGIAKWSDSFSFFMISLSHVTPSSPPAPSLLPHFTDFHLFDPFPQDLDSWWDAPSNKHACCSDSNRGTPWLELLHNYHREVGMCNLELPINLNPLTNWREPTQTWWEHKNSKVCDQMLHLNRSFLVWGNSANHQGALSLISLIFIKSTY